MQGLGVLGLSLGVWGLGSGVLGLYGLGHWVGIFVGFLWGFASCFDWVRKEG